MLRASLARGCTTAITRSINSGDPASIPGESLPKATINRTMQSQTISRRPAPLIQCVARWGALATLMLGACVNAGPWQVQLPPWTPEVVAEASEVRIHTLDAKETVLRQVTIDTEAPIPCLNGKVFKAATKSAPDAHAQLVAVQIQLSEIAGLETRHLETRSAVETVAMGIGLVTVAFFVILISALSRPGYSGQ